MFDDHTNSPTGGAVPSNLPIGEPDDMFAGAGDAEPALPQPEPINLPPTALDAGVLRPKIEAAPAPMPASATEMPPLAEPMSEMPAAAMPPRREPMAPMPMPTNVNSDGVLSAPLGGHKALITVIVLLSVIIVGGGAAWAYFTFINPKDTQVLPSNNTILPPTSTDSAIPETEPVTTTDDVVQGSTSTDNRILFGEPVLDTDSDGLDDNVEKEKGTNMLAWDSDGDTLSDGDEVLTWKTDPLKADTDGDTYEDAAEIKNGYNPNGDGKLFAINATSTASNTTTSTQAAETKP